VCVCLCMWAGVHLPSPPVRECVCVCVCVCVYGVWGPMFSVCVCVCMYGCQCSSCVCVCVYGGWCSSCVCVCVCVYGGRCSSCVCVCVCVCVWGPVFFVCVLGGLVFSVCVCVWGPVFISLSLHDLPVYCPLTTGPILLLSLLMHQQAWPPSVTRGVLSRTVSHTQFQFHGERTGPGQAWLGCPRLVQGTAHWSVSGSGMRVASPKGARPGQTEFQKLPAGLWAWVACGRGTEVRTGALSARSCTGRGVRDLLGPIPHRPPHVELRVPLDRGPAPGLPVRARHLWSLLLPQLGRQPCALQPHVHPLPGRLPGGHVPGDPVPWPQSPPQLLQPQQGDISTSSSMAGRLEEKPTRP